MVGHRIFRIPFSPPGGVCKPHGKKTVNPNGLGDRKQKPMKGGSNLVKFRTTPRGEGKEAA
jgi:hypothetical protein